MSIQTFLEEKQVETPANVTETTTPTIKETIEEQEVEQEKVVEQAKEVINEKEKAELEIAEKLKETDITPTNIVKEKNPLIWDDDDIDEVNNDILKTKYGIDEFTPDKVTAKLKEYESKLDPDYENPFVKKMLEFVKEGKNIQDLVKLIDPTDYSKWTKDDYSANALKLYTEHLNSKDLSPDELEEELAVFNEWTALQKREKAEELVEKKQSFSKSLETQVATQKAIQYEVMRNEREFIEQTIQSFAEKAKGQKVYETEVTDDHLKKVQQDLFKGLGHIRDATPENPLTPKEIEMSLKKAFNRTLALATFEDNLKKVKETTEYKTKKEIIDSTRLPSKNDTPKGTQNSKPSEKELEAEYHANYQNRTYVKP